VSELRVSELLDDLCEDMDDFDWAQRNSTDGTEWAWVRTRYALACVHVTRAERVSVCRCVCEAAAQSCRCLARCLRTRARRGERS